MEERDATHHDTRETLARRLRIEPIDTTTDSRCTQHSYNGEDTFLSHSGQQKNFVRQLHKDLRNQGISCFFDQDRESLPLGSHFPSRIFEAAETCQVAVLLLSKDFLESKWPMLELSAFVEAKNTKNKKLQILPFFYKITLDALDQITVDNEKWTKFEKVDNEKRAEMHRALRVVRGLNGLIFSEGDDEVKFREEIVTGIWTVLSMPSPRYHVCGMQGEERMCQELATFFSNVMPNRKGIRIAALYGIAGEGKSTIGKTFCNFNLREFKGRVCHLEFSKGGPIRNIKLALQYLTHRPDSYVQFLTSLDQEKLELERRIKGQRVLLVLDNIIEECINEVLYYVKAELGENSWVLLSARSVDLLVKHFKIESKSCVRVPRLEEKEAISILLERTFADESKVEEQDRGFALKCAKRCLFRDTSCDIGPRFHPLALKAFGGYLMSRHGSNLSKWGAEVDGMVYGSGDGLDEVLAVLCRAFDDMDPTYQTIFILLAVYRPSNMSPHKVTEWLAICCNKEIKDIEKAVKVLEKKAFIESFEAEIRIHDLYIEFAQSRAKRMERWLWWKGNEPSTRGLISNSKAGFELAKFEQCMYRSPSQIAPRHLQNLCVLQLVGVDRMVSLNLIVMKSLRSVTLQNCKSLRELKGMGELTEMAWLQIRDVNRMLKLPHLSSLLALQYLDIDNSESRVVIDLGDLTRCLFLREIIVRCPSLLKFPKVNGLPYLQKVEFSECDQVKNTLDCTDCVELQSIVLTFCSQMVSLPLIAGCKKLSNTVLSDCDAVTACPEISQEAASAPETLESYCGLENLELWNMRKLKELPSFKRLSNLTVLKLGKCGITELPDLTCCVMLEEVYFYSLRNLKRYPNFSFLRELKILSICDCIRVQDPPDIWGCHKLQEFLLLYNDNMNGPSKILAVSKLSDFLSGREYQDGNWLNKVRRYFGESAASEDLKRHGNDPRLPESILEWKGALRTVASIPGWCSGDYSSDNDLIQEIMVEIQKILHSDSPQHLDVPVCFGLDRSVKNVKGLLNAAHQKKIVKLGIHGMSGIGKTTLAKAVCKELISEFEVFSFVPSVGEICEDANGL